MASILRIKRSELSGNPAVLGAGELAYSALANNGSNGGDRLYIGTGTESGGNAVNHVVIGGKYFTDMIDAATAAKTANALVKRNADGAAYLDIVGNVLGNVTGDISGNFTGDVVGDVTGDVTGDVVGNVSGNISSTGLSTFSNIAITGGTINSTTIGATTASTIRGTTITATTGFVGDLTGNVTGNLTGNVTGDVTGNLIGDVYAGNGTSKILESGTDGTNATFTGNVTGNVVGNLTGDVLGNLVGNVTGNVTGNITSTGSSSFSSATITGGSINSTAIGATTASTVRGTTITATTGFVGDVTGAVTGDVTGNVTGNLTGNAGTATRLLNTRDLSLTGDATATLSSFDGSANVSGALTLATVNTNVGTFGSATAIPVVTVNGKGLVTGVTTANIATNLGIAGDTGTDQVSLLTDTLTFEGGNGLVATVTNNKVTIGLTGSININDLTIASINAGSVTVTGALSAGDTSTANINVNGNAVITGNLTVQGTTTTVNSTTVAIGDKNIELAKDSTTAIGSDGAGITITGPTIPATITYSAIDNRWNLNKDLNVGTVYGALSGNASTATTWATGRNLNLTGDASASLLSVDGSANVSATLTLATVNTNVGSYGDSVTVPNFTVNAKGLITAAGSTAIPFAGTSTKGLASFDSTQFSITSGAVSIAQIDGGSY